MLKFSEFKEHLLVSLKPNELDKLILRIKEKFILKREQIKDYTLGDAEVSAYTTFYGYSNYHKLAEIFKWLPEDVLKQLSETALIDVGSGPGIFSLAWQEIFQSDEIITQIETSKPMKEQAHKLMKAFYPEVSISQDLKARGRQTMLFGHSFNEIGLQESYQMIKKVQPEFVLFIEPGTKEVFKDILEIREKLFSDGYQMKFPCLTNDPCPLTHQDRDWCHQYLYLKYDQEYESLTQHLKMDRKKLPITVHLYHKTEQINSAKDGQARIIRVYKETKFSLDFDLCVGEKVFKFQVLKKNLSKDQKKHLKNFKSGDLIKIKITKEVKADLIRGEIIFSNELSE